MRRRLQSLRRDVHAEPAAVRAAVDEMPGLQKAGAENHFGVHHAAQAQAAVGHGRQKGRVSGL